MSKPKFRRRKDERPGEITRAAFQAFAENGYDGTRVTDVARRAGVSKGLLYVYFRTKEELFKAVVKSVVVPKLDRLSAALDDGGLSAEAFLRGPFAAVARELPRSRARVIVKLMIAEGSNHPDLTAWYWENVVAKGVALLRRLVDRGVASGEFRPSALQEYPHMLFAPVLFSIAWKLVFSPHHDLDTDRLVDSHIGLLLDAVRTGEAART